MASNGKKRTTMAKLNRETKMREKRLDKQAKKDAKKRGDYVPRHVEEAPEPLVADEGSPSAA